LKDEVIEKYVDEYVLRKRPRRTSDSLRYAREKVDGAWSSLQGKLEVVSGKSLISLLSTWSQNALGTSIGVAALLQSMRRDDVDDEVISVMTAIERCRRFITASG
jgi:hypothetical protein